MNRTESEQTSLQMALSRRQVVKRGILAGLGLTALPAFLAACDDDGSGGGDSGGAHIGLSLGTLSQRRWQFDRQYIKEEAQNRGLKLSVQSANNDTRLQANQVENLIAQGIDVLILSPIDVSASAPSVAAAKSAGVPVISYNSVVKDSDIDYWVARDNVAVGTLQAQLAVKSVPTGNYVIVSGEGGVDIAQEKTEGNMKVLQPLIDSGDINLVSQRYHTAWDPAKGLAQVEDALGSTKNQVDAILCNYDGFIVPSLPALKGAGLLGKTWVGGEDVFPEVARAIVQGNVAMTAYTPLKEMAQKAVAAAVALADGKKPKTDASTNNGMKDVRGSEVNAIAVTKENMRDFLKETGWLKTSEVY